MSHFRKVCKFTKFADCQFAELVFGPPTYDLYTEQFIIMLGSVPNRKMIFFLLKLASLVYSKHKG
jgi:hypothetical protein